MSGALGTAVRPVAGFERTEAVHLKGTALQKAGKGAGRSGKPPEQEEAQRVDGGPAQFDRMAQNGKLGRIEQREKHRFRNATDDK